MDGRIVWVPGGVGGLTYAAYELPGGEVVGLTDPRAQACLDAALDVEGLVLTPEEELADEAEIREYLSRHAAYEATTTTL